MIRRFSTIFSPLLLSLCLFLTGMALAQETRGTISGTATDSSGAVVAGTKMTITNVDTGVAFTATTNAAGQYRFLFLNPGGYRVVAEAAGFKNFVRENILLQVSQATTIDVALELGAVSETVTVSTQVALLDTEKVDRGVVIENKIVTSLPLNLRNPMLLISLSTGVARTTPGANARPFSNSGISQWSVNGGQLQQNDFLMDGAPNNAVYGKANTVGYVPPVDAMAEFKIMTGSYDAQYGRTGGGVVNLSIKSGTNAPHGSAYEFLKRTYLNANTFSNNAKNQPRQGATLDQYGLTLGGPVRIPKLYDGKDKTFFFFSWEGYKEEIYYPDESISSVPTLEQRKGDFSKTFDNSGGLMSIFDPLTGRMENNRWVRSAFPGNVIPKDRIDPFGLNVANLYPAPNTSVPGSTAWQNNFSLSPNAGTFDFNNFVGRVDHSFGPRERVYGRLNHSRSKELRNANGIPGLGNAYRYGGNTSQGAVVDSITMITPVTIFNFRVAFTHFDNHYLLYGQDGFSATQLGWPQALVNQLPEPTMVPNIDITDYRALGQRAVAYEPSNLLSVQPNVAIVRGRHTIKAGLDFRTTRYTNLVPGGAGGYLSYDRQFTRRDYLTQDGTSGNAIASLLLGSPASGRVDVNVRPYWQWLYYAPWVQDDIRLSRKLTLNLGLRWDFNMPPTERFNLMNRDFLATTVNPISSQIDQKNFPGLKVYGGYGFVGVNGMPRTPWDADLNNLQPRVGAAYQLSGKTVLRGGWGIFYQNPTSTSTNNGFSQSTPYVATLDSGRTAAGTASNPFPTGILAPPGASRGMATFLGQGTPFANTKARVPYVHQFSFGIQRQLPGRIKLDASYVGSRSRAALVSKGYNEISLENMALGDRAKGGDPNYLNQQVPNPFQNLIPGTALNNATVARSQMLRPFPEFTGFSMTDRNDGRYWYNSMQLALEKGYSNGLTLTASYTLAKNIEGVTYLNAQDLAPTRSLVAWDTPHQLSFAPIYELPFGPGRRFANGTHGVLSRLAGGWQAIFTGTARAGMPMGIPGNVYLLGDPRLPNPTWDRLFKTGVIDANGAVRGVLAGEQPVFQVRQPFTLRTTPSRYGNLRNQAARTFDFSLIKATRLREGMTFQFRLEMFNIFNTSSFTADPNQDPTSPNFGKLFRDNGQDNLPRTIQFGFRLLF